VHTSRSIAGVEGSASLLKAMCQRDTAKRKVEARATGKRKISRVSK